MARIRKPNRAVGVVEEEKRRARLMAFWVLSLAPYNQGTRTMIELQAAQLIVPLMDFIARWTMYGDADKLQARTYLRELAGFNRDEWRAIDTFLDALDTPPEDCN